MDAALLKEYLDLCEQMKRIQTQKLEVEKNILNGLINTKDERAKFQNKLFSIIQKCKYAFDVPSVHSVLDPKSLFFKVIKVDKKEYDQVLNQPDLFSEDEIEKLLTAFSVTEAHTKLSVRTERVG